MDVNRDGKRNGAYSLVELSIVIAIAGIAIAIGSLAMSSWIRAERVKSASRQIADLLVHGRGEAVRTGSTHLLFFNTDAGSASLVAPDGNPAAAMLIRDADGDGNIDAGEYVSSVPLDGTSTLSWGVSVATLPVPTDPTPNHTAPPPSPWTFTQPGGAAANWVAVFPDGTPRGFGVAPFAAGAMGSGSGAIYLTDGTADYAVVLASLGGVRVHGWDRNTGLWRQ